MNEAQELAPERAGWRMKEWCQVLGISKTKAFELLKGEQAPESVQLGRVRIILESPRDYLARMQSEHRKKVTQAALDAVAARQVVA